MKRKGPHEYAPNDTSASHDEQPCRKCRREDCSGCCCCRSLYALNLESKKLFQQMLGDSTKRLHRLEKCFLVVARYIQGDDSARDIQLDDRILPMTKNAMVNEAVKRLLKGDAKPKLVFREILADYKDIPGAYHDLEALRRQVYRVLRKQA